MTDLEGLQGGYPHPPLEIFEQPETPVKKDPHVARLTSGQLRSLPSLIWRRDFGRGGDLWWPSHEAAITPSKGASPECSSAFRYGL